MRTPSMPTVADGTHGRIWTVGGEREHGTPHPGIGGRAATGMMSRMHSRYVVGSLCLSGASALWLVAACRGVPLPFDVYKQHRVGGAAGAVALVFALAAYCGPNRRRGMTHVAVAVAVLVCLAYCVVLPV